jgi:hypothetical protein
MELGLLIGFFFFISFGPPLFCYIMAFARRKKDPRMMKTFLILGTIWLIIGGGTCLSILS